MSWGPYENGFAGRMYGFAGGCWPAGGSLETFALGKIVWDTNNVLNCM